MAEGRRVPSDRWPTLAGAIADAVDGTHIEVLPGHREITDGPIIIDKAIFVEGPHDRSAVICGQDGIIIAGEVTEDTILLRRLRIRMTGAPGLVGMVLAGGCTLEDCEIEATAVGIEVTAQAGQAVRLSRTIVRNCQTGVSLAGGAAAAVFDKIKIEACQHGLVITGLDVQEGWNDVLSSLVDVALVGNEDSDLRLRGWSVKEKGPDGALRQAPPNEEVSVRGWPQEQGTVVVPTDRGAVILHFIVGRVNATLFEDEEAEDPADEGVDCSPRTPRLENLTSGDAPTRAKNAIEMLAVKEGRSAIAVDDSG